MTKLSTTKPKSITKPEPNYRKQLNNEQYRILGLLAKFRFSTRALLSQHFAKTNPGMDVFRRLQVLEDRRLINKRHEPRYRLLHKPAAYYLLPEGARSLQAWWDATNVDKAINIKTIYKDKGVSEQFVEHCVAIFATSNLLHAQYAGKLGFFTKSQLTEYDYFPEKLPDGYIQLELNSEEDDEVKDKHFFLDIYHDNQPFFTAVRRVKAYAEYCGSGEWAETNEPFPTILAVCDSPTLLKRLRKSMKRALDESWDEELKFALTTKAELERGKRDIWQRPEDEEFLGLEDL